MLDYKNIKNAQFLAHFFLYLKKILNKEKQFKQGIILKKKPLSISIKYFFGS